jgi:hypothetical protein
MQWQYLGKILSRSASYKCDRFAENFSHVKVFSLLFLREKSSKKKKKKKEKQKNREELAWKWTIKLWKLKSNEDHFIF